MFREKLGRVQLGRKKIEKEWRRNGKDKSSIKRIRKG